MSGTTVTEQSIPEVLCCSAFPQSYGVNRLSGMYVEALAYSDDYQAGRVCGPLIAWFCFNVGVWWP